MQKLFFCPFRLPNIERFMILFAKETSKMTKYSLLFTVVILSLSTVSSAELPRAGKPLDIEPVWLDSPRKSMFPRSNKPSQTISIFDTRDIDYEDVLLAVTAQGLINRDIPKLYLYVKKTRR